MSEPTKNEEILWTGSPSTAVRLRIIHLFFLVALLPLISFLVMILLFPNDSHFYLIFIIVLNNISMTMIFFVMSRQVLKTKYVIKNETLCWKWNDYEEKLLLSLIQRLKIKKSRIEDVSHLNTGTIFFYLNMEEEFKRKFAHIEQVDEVADLIKRLISYQ